jgi:hypothetical protein
MGDGFASVGAVVDDEAEAARELKFLGDQAGGEQEVAEGGLVVGRGFADAGDDGFGDDEQVDGGLRLDVMNDDAVLVFVLDARGYFSGDDAFEEGRHGGCVNVQ